MSKIKNPKIYEIALQTGGSHYPGVGGALLEQFAERIIREAADVAGFHDKDAFVSQRIKEHFGIKNETN